MNRRPRTPAIVTVLGWNLLPATAVVAGALSAHAQIVRGGGVGFSELTLRALLTFGVGGVVVGTAIGVAIAAAILTRRTRSGRPGSMGAAIGWGTLAAFLGWVPAIAYLVVAIGRLQFNGGF